MSNRRGEKMSLFSGGDDLQSVANDIYGGSADIPDSGRVVARPTSILQIWADVKQPRRAIPLSIRMHWDGNPVSVPDLLRQWHQVAEESAGAAIDVDMLLNGQGEGIDADKFPSVAQDYLKLVRFAAGIKADGLMNPITIIESDSKLLIESGERRWLAFHLLNSSYPDDKWAKIPAAKGNVNDSVWRQCTENMQRIDLNAIGKARQIALLIMAAREAAGFTYQTYEDVVINGLSDRRFYAQVADGNVHRIPNGMKERIEAAMFLSMEQISQYRRLLRLTLDETVNDAIWTKADVENWSENAMRELSTLTAVKVHEVIERPNWTLDDLKALKEAPVSKPFDYPAPPTAQTVVPRRPVTSEWMHKRVMTKGNQMATVTNVDGDRIVVAMPNGQKQSFHYTELTLMGDRPSAPAVTNSVPGFSHDFRMGDTVRTRTGHEGEVIGLSGRLVTVRTANGTNAHDHTLLTKVAAPVPVEDSPFVIGEAVRTQWGRKGVVGGLRDQMVLIKWNDGNDHAELHHTHIWADEEPTINEDEIEADFDPDAPAPAREWSEGISIGGNNQTPSDNVDSVEPKRIFFLGSDEWLFLDALHDLAVLSNDDGVASLLTDLSDATDQKVLAMAADETLEPELYNAYNQLRAAMEVWHQVQFASILQKVRNAAVN